MAAVVGSLLAQLQVDKTGLASGLRAAGVDMSRFERTTNQRFQSLDRKTGTAFASMGRHVTTFSRGLVGGIAGAVTAAGFTALIRGANDAARSIARIGDQAKQAGLDVRSFQMLAYVAKQNRIEVDDLTAGVREMQLRFSEFVQSAGKSGSAADQLKRLGYSVDEIGTKLQTPLSLFSEIIGRVQKLDKAGQILAMDELFGGDGERLIRILDQGEDGLARMIQRAEDVGAVLSEDVIRNADEINRRFEEISDTVSLNLKAAIVEASTALVDFINSFNGLDAQRTAKLEEQLVDLGRERLEIENQIHSLREDMATNDGFFAPAENRLTAGTISALEDQMAAITSREAEILGVIGQRDYEKAGQQAGTGFADGAKKGIETGSQKVSRAAGSAGRDALREFERFADDANRLAEEMFPAEFARREAEQLLVLMEKFGGRLDDFQRQAVENRIGVMFDSAAAGVRDLSADAKDAGQEMEDAFSPVADLIGDLFSKPLDDLDDFLDRSLRGFAQIGQANLWNVMDSLFGASDDPSKSARLVGKEIGRAAAPEVAEGTAIGAAAGISRLLAPAAGAGVADGSFSKMLGGSGGFLSAGLGGLGMGYETQSPVMGALGGALSGLSAGPVGAIVGGIAGLRLGGSMSKSQKEGNKQ